MRRRAAGATASRRPDVVFRRPCQPADHRPPVRPTVGGECAARPFEINPGWPKGKPASKITSKPGACQTVGDRQPSKLQIEAGARDCSPSRRVCRRSEPGRIAGHDPLLSSKRLKNELKTSLDGGQMNHPRCGSLRGGSRSWNSARPAALRPRFFCSSRWLAVASRASDLLESWSASWRDR